MEIPDMNAATKPTKFLKTAWTESWTISEGDQHPNDSAAVQLQRLASPALKAMTFAKTAMPCNAC